MDSPSTQYTLTVSPEDAGKRLDAYLTVQFAEFSRAQIQRFIEEDALLVNEKPVRASYKTRNGDAITLTPPTVRSSEILAQDIPLDIVFEDGDILVINKPKGLVVHPAPGAYEGTLVNALLFHCKDLSGIGGVERPGIVHRLDKDTTGLVVVAKNDAAHQDLQAQIQARTMKRRYQAILWGVPTFTEAVIDAAIDRHPTDRLRMAVREGGRSAVTEVSVHETLGVCSLVECRLQTGRTHQIRVHLQYAGHPVVGDSVYGGMRKSSVALLDSYVATLTGQALHAYELHLTHPRTGEEKIFQSPLPTEMQSLLTLLRQI
jgi:23S rRNA pseudouridine1911/1915/1917 synthase